MSDRTARRRELLWDSCRADGVDAVLVASVTNVGYLTGFSGDDSTLLLMKGRAIVISDGRYETQLKAECPDVQVHIRPVGQLMGPGVAEVAGKLGVRKLGFEAAVLTVDDHLKLRELMKATDLVPMTDKVEALRVVKDDLEVAAIREAIAYAEQAFAAVTAGLRPEQTEKDVADAIEFAVRRAGASATSFPPIVGVGRNAALPHYRPSADVRIGADDFVLIDWGAAGRPYKSDLTRVVVTGKVTPKFAEVYRAVLAAQERGIAAIRPGVAGRDVDAQARAVIHEAGFGEFFNHGLGHGLGMDIHEAPRLRKEADTPLRPGMVVTVEPGIYLPDWGGVRIEDDVLVTPDGCEVLTHVPKALDALRAG